MNNTSAQLIELNRTECLELLGDNRFGRVVVTTAHSEMPMIRPVYYVFDLPSQSVAFRTGEGSKFHALVHSTQACFEIDALDPETLSGWSVIIAGRTEQISNPTEIRRLEERDLVSPAVGAHSHWVRIRARTVSGRRVVRTAA